MKTHQPRVRIAPSPTGDPHVGTAYVALFNYVFAKQQGGSFILRIEDTDQQRTRTGSEQKIYEGLRWLGLDWDEGPDKGGPYGPYRQSERKDIYLKYTHMLIEKGAAYYCFCTPERLESMRKKQREEGLPSKYDRLCCQLSHQEVEDRLKSGMAHVVRLKVPDHVKVVRFVDTLRGEIEIPIEQLDDQVLLKSDGMPTYHLANVVDDHLMKVTHVIRAEEWIASTPKHVLLYQAFGWEEPQWVHMPLLRNKDKSKISKRKNPVSLSYYQRVGYLPQAMRNFLALLGWNPGHDQEIFDMDEMIKKFSFESVHLGGPVFDIDKLNWLNQHYMLELDVDSYVHSLRDQFFSIDYLRALYPLFRERVPRFDMFFEKASFCFVADLAIDVPSIVPRALSETEFKKIFTDLAEKLDDLYDWDEQHLEALLLTHRESVGLKAKDYLMPLRLMTTGRKDSPPLIPTLVVLGREIVRYRLRSALEQL